MDYVLTYNGKDYPVTEPTVDTWMDLTALQDFEDNLEFAIKLIALSTGLKPDQIKEHDWFEILQVASGISEYFKEQYDKFHDTFELNGITYKFIDLSNMSFGEFIDIDMFLSKPEAIRKRELHYHMALLYREVDENGNLTKYDSSKVEERAQKMKKAPIKIVNGALVFFWAIETELRKHTGGYLKKLLWVKTMMIRTRMVIVLLSFGVGTLRLWSWLRKTSQRFLKWLKSPLQRS